MPSTSHINQAFAALAIAVGLDSAIINPEDRDLLTMIYAAELLMGMDRHCLNYNRAYRAGKIGRAKRPKEEMS
jgi:5-methyltetrahydrofolate--homocysteine methyltransferase